MSLAQAGAIYYIAPDRTLMIVDVKIKGTELEASLPRKLFGQNWQPGKK